MPSGPLPPDTPARCTIHCLGPSEALSLLASRAWTAARAPDCAPQRPPRAWLRGKVLPVGQPGCPAQKSHQPPQHSPEAGFAQCPAPTSGHHHLSLQRLQPPPGQCPLCPFWSGLPRSTPSMWPPGSCPMDPASPARVQTLTSRAVGAAESFHPWLKCRHVFPGAGAGCGGGTSRGLDALSTQIPLSGSEPQTAAFCPPHPSPPHLPSCPHPPLGAVPWVSRDLAAKAGTGTSLPSPSAFSLAPSLPPRCVVSPALDQPLFLSSLLDVAHPQSARPPQAARYPLQPSALNLTQHVARGRPGGQPTSSSVSTRQNEGLPLFLGTMEGG